jgi:hypothetical protein
VRRSAAALALAGWTAFVWLTRIRNAARDGDSLLPYALSVAFLVLAVGTLATLGRDRRWVYGLAGLTVVVWPIRLFDIAFGSDHGVGFILVHVAIGLVSVGLAALAAREVVRARRLASAE